MKKKILIGSIFAVLIMLSMPAISNIQAQSVAQSQPAPILDWPADKKCKEWTLIKNEFLTMATILRNNADQLRARGYDEAADQMDEDAARYERWAARAGVFMNFWCGIADITPWGSCSLCSDA